MTISSIIHHFVQSVCSDWKYVSEQLSSKYPAPKDITAQIINFFLTLLRNSFSSSSIGFNFFSVRKWILPKAPLRALIISFAGFLDNLSGLGLATDSTLDLTEATTSRSG